MKTTPNFKRVLLAAAGYAVFFLMPVVMPSRPVELLVQCGLAAVVTVTMTAGFVTGTWTERFVCAALGSPALWYLVRVIPPILTGEPIFADA